MIDKLNGAFMYQQAALGLRQQRQEVLATNIANADTPNYKARDFNFSQVLARQMGGGLQASGFALATTAPAHLNASSHSRSGAPALEYRDALQPSIDGNTVDMDRERAHFADNAMRMQASLSLMSTSLQGMRSAMQPE